jgi:type II secretory ATPase GspE/PulE/Tfp pilus assembly ATPase PilB-like protein
MTLKLPILTKKNFNIARIACLAVSGLIVLLLSPKFPSKDFLDGLTGSIGIGSEPIRVLFLVIFALLLNSVFTYAVRGLWLRLEKEPEHTAIIKTGDLQINTSRGIAGVPYFRSRLKYIIDSPENSVVDMLNTVIGTGFSLEASDIHISPDVNTAEVVMRIHGNLYPICDIPVQLYSHFVRRIKIVSGLSIFKQGVPQDGQISFEDTSYTARISVFPTSNGERIAIRLASSHSGIMNLESIGMPDDILLDYRALLNRSQGMIVITGPTGSGKSTTMFASLLDIQKQRKDSVNIVTLEDPIETNLKGFQQTQVGQSTGLTFSSGLRSVLRQDPDVIMVGEIRDEETASISIRAAMTGHQILTTVHANSTSGVFNRLSQMGVDPVQLSSTIHAVLSQRLCRRLCQSCRQEKELTEAHIRQLKLLGLLEIPDGPFFESDGCDECIGLGFTGRVPLFEMFLVTDKLRDFISKGCPAHQLSREARNAGMRTLLDHGLELAREGMISLMELTRVVSE